MRYPKTASRTAPGRGARAPLPRFPALSGAVHAARRGRMRPGRSRPQGSCGGRHDPRFLPRPRACRAARLSAPPGSRAEIPAHAIEDATEWKRGQAGSRLPATAWPRPAGGTTTGQVPGRASLQPSPRPAPERSRQCGPTPPRCRDGTTQDRAGGAVCISATSRVWPPRPRPARHRCAPGDPGAQRLIRVRCRPPFPPR